MNEKVGAKILTMNSAGYKNKIRCGKFFPQFKSSNFSDFHFFSFHFFSFHQGSKRFNFSAKFLQIE